MALKENDLAGVLLPKLSIDEFEPKTGEKENISVLGFYVTEESAGEDLANFINKSTFDYRDVEVSPNPTEDNEFMVFVEFDRNETLIPTIMELVNDISHVSGKLEWKAKPLLSEDPINLEAGMLETWVATSSEDYMTKEDYDSKQQQEEQDRVDSIQNFLTDNTNADVVLKDNILKLKDYKYSVNLEFINYGEGKLTLEESGLSELAIDSDFDFSLMKQLNSMKGNLSIVPINKHIVFHNPATDQVLIAKPC
jgi:hypothetical protein